METIPLAASIEAGIEAIRRARPIGSRPGDYRVAASIPGFRKIGCNLRSGLRYSFRIGDEYPFPRSSLDSLKFIKTQLTVLSFRRRIPFRPVIRRPIAESLLRDDESAGFLDLLVEMAPDRVFRSLINHRRPPIAIPTPTARERPGGGDRAVTRVSRNGSSFSGPIDRDALAVRSPPLFPRDGTGSRPRWVRRSPRACRLSPATLATVSRAEKALSAQSSRTICR